ncbi:MAG: hypothetical protein WC455_10490 [Dehalococcoidia bacterium]|jgi:hypothetical protein
MTKQEAIKAMVKEFQAIPQDWVRDIIEKDGDYASLPAWGTMFITDLCGEEMMENSRRMLGDKSELADEIKNMDEDDEERVKLQKALDEDDWDVLSNYIDEDMSGCQCVLDKDGAATNIFIYEVRGEYVLGVHAYGFDFYNGVWDRLYDTLGLNWHSEE